MKSGISELKTFDKRFLQSFKYFSEFCIKKGYKPNPDHDDDKHDDDKARHEKLEKVKIRKLFNLFPESKVSL